MELMDDGTLKRGMRAYSHSNLYTYGKLPCFLKGIDVDSLSTLMFLYNNQPYKIMRSEPEQPLFFVFDKSKKDFPQLLVSRSIRILEVVEETQYALGVNLEISFRGLWILFMVERAVLNLNRFGPYNKYV